MSVYDSIQKKLNEVLAKELLPKLAEVATDIVLNMGDEPPSKDSINILFEDAFRKVLNCPKKTSPKKKKTKEIVPKPQKSKWITLAEMKTQLQESNGEKYFCGFVADRGPNKRKFCGVELIGINCGTMNDEKVWSPHSPEDELKAVKEMRNMRCKNCWAVGKTGAYRKTGGFMKFYSDELINEQDEQDEQDEPQVSDEEETYNPYPDDDPDDGTF